MTDEFERLLAEAVDTKMLLEEQFRGLLAMETPQRKGWWISHEFWRAVGKAREQRADRERERERDLCDCDDCIAQEKVRAAREREEE